MSCTLDKDDSEPALTITDAVSSERDTFMNILQVTQSRETN